MSDWLEHDGKGMPVNANARVDLLFRDGDKRIGRAGFWGGLEGDVTFNQWVWQWDDYDIVAYRVIQDPASQAMDELIEASSEELDIPSSQANREGEER